MTHTGLAHAFAHTLSTAVWPSASHMTHGQVDPTCNGPHLGTPAKLEILRSWTGLDWTLIWKGILGIGLDSSLAKDKIGLLPQQWEGDGTLEGNHLHFTSLVKPSMKPHPPMGPQGIHFLMEP